MKDVKRKGKDVISEIVYRLDENDKESSLDIDLKDDVCTVISKSGTHVINFNSHLNEIWVSSCVSGPHHFKFSDGKWINNSGKELTNLIEDEFGCLIK